MQTRIMNLPLVRRANWLRSFLNAAWLGWQIESNWADPWLFAIYSIVRPISSVLILVVMYSVITNGATDQPIFAYIYLGNALYILVGQVVSGVSWAVVSDREQYRIVRQLYTTPLNDYFYLMGRGVARLLIGLVSLVITIGFGVVAFRLPVSLQTVDWSLFLLSMLIGILSLAALGHIMGAITMMTARQVGSVGDAVAGALYLFSGAIFPLDLLPAVLRPIGLIFPATYWLELTRRALLGPDYQGFETFAALSNLQLLGILVAATAILIVASVLIYRWAFNRARETGFFDMETNF
jgi:ABC-2 type transport system permease protein